MAPKRKTTRAKAATKRKPAAKQTTLRSRSFGRQVLKASTRQTGESNKKRDSARKALAPGKRRAASGGVYYEYRKNRSDVRGRRV